MALHTSEAFFGFDASPRIQPVSLSKPAIIYRERPVRNTNGQIIYYLLETSLGGFEKEYQQQDADCIRWSVRGRGGVAYVKEYPGTNKREFWLDCPEGGVSLAYTHPLFAHLFRNNVDYTIVSGLEGQKQIYLKRY